MSTPQVPLRVITVGVRSGQVVKRVEPVEPAVVKKTD